MDYADIEKGIAQLGEKAKHNQVREKFYDDETQDTPIFLNAFSYRSKIWTEELLQFQMEECSGLCLERP